MNKAHFLERLNKMAVDEDSRSTLYEIIVSRLYQCSFIRDHYEEVGIILSSMQSRLLDNFQEKLMHHYMTLVKNREMDALIPIFTISNFDGFIQNFILQQLD